MAVLMPQDSGAANIRAVSLAAHTARGGGPPFCGEGVATCTFFDIEGRGSVKLKMRFTKNGQPLLNKQGVEYGLVDLGPYSSGRWEYCFDPLFVASLGEAKIDVTFDPLHEVAETDELDNTTSISINVVDPVPLDFYTTSVALYDTSYQPITELVAGKRVRLGVNFGLKSCEPAKVPIDYFLDGYKVASLDTEAVVGCCWRWQPGYEWNLAPGRHRIEGVLDPLNKFAESDETNNRAVLDFTVAGNRATIEVEPRSIAISRPQNAGAEPFCSLSRGVRIYLTDGVALTPVNLASDELCSMDYFQYLDLVEAAHGTTSVAKESEPKVKDIQGSDSTSVVDGSQLFDKGTSTTISTSMLHFRGRWDIGSRAYHETFFSDPKLVVLYLKETMDRVSLIYARDLNTTLGIDEIVIWTVPEPFERSAAHLDDFAAYYNDNPPAKSFDYHYYLASDHGGHGVAYIGSLGNRKSYYGFMNGGGPRRAIYWSAIAHEMGHTFSSPHTHCYSPPIDCCVSSECGCSPEAEVNGEIMSYCKTGNSGFSERVRQVMRSFAEVSGASDPPPYNLQRASLTVRNSGKYPLSLYGIFSDNQPRWLKIPLTESYILQPGESERLAAFVDVTLLPAGAVTQHLRIASSDGANSPLDVRIEVPAGTSAGQNSF